MADVIRLDTGGVVGNGAVVDIDNVLDGAKGKLRQALVVGIGIEDGQLYVACSHGEPEALVLASRAVKFILDQMEG